MESAEATATRETDTAEVRMRQPSAGLASMAMTLDRASDALAAAEAVLMRRTAAHETTAATLRRLIARAQHAAQVV